MSVIGEFTVPASALAMDQTLAATPGTTVEIERVVAYESGTLTPYFWFRGGNGERFETAIAGDPSVSESTRLDDFDNGTLYRAEWPQNVESVGHTYFRRARPSSRRRASPGVGTSPAVRHPRGRLDLLRVLRGPRHPVRGEPDLQSDGPEVG